MWLAVDAAGPGVTAWPVGEDGAPGAAVAAPDLERALARSAAAAAVVDGASGAPAVDHPAGIAELAAAVARRQVAGAECAFLPRLTLGGVTLGGVARPVGALHQMQAERPASRAQLVCLIDRQVEWVYAMQGRVTRLRCADTPARLAALLRGNTALDAEAADADDDVGFERGLSLGADGGDPAALVGGVLAEAAADRRRGGALGAMLAGILVGADARTGLGMGRLGGPVALVGATDPQAGLTAQRYATALGRFGVAVRRLAPPAAFVRGCGALAGGNPARPDAETIGVTNRAR